MSQKILFSFCFFPSVSHFHDQLSDLSTSKKDKYAPHSNNQLSIHPHPTNTKSPQAAKMPKLNPKIHEFANLFTHYSSHGITPTGWRELKKPTESHSCSLWRVLGSKKRYEAPLTQLKYSLTKISQSAGDKKEIEGEELLTLTVPNLPMRSWWPFNHGQFNPPDEVKVIIFEADGYRLERDPVYEELISNNQMVPTTPRLKPLVYERENRDVPEWTLGTTVDVEEEEERRDSLLDGDEMVQPSTAQLIKELEADFGELF